MAPKEPMSLHDVRAGLGVPQDIEDASVVLTWLEERIANPHPLMPHLKDPSRPRLICPTMPHLLKSPDALNFVVHPELDGTNEADIIELVIGYLPFMEAECAGSYTSLVMIFPGIPTEHEKVLNPCQEKVKNTTIKQDIMAGQFFETCTHASMRNPNFKDVLSSPIPLIVFRKIQIYDLPFLDKTAEHFRAYDKLFGDPEALSRYDPKILAKYQVAKERFG